MPYGITQCYLPPGRCDIPACTPFTVANRSTEVFHKAISGLHHFKYTKRLDVRCTESLELRLLRYDMIYVYKMLFSLVDLNFDDFFARSSCSK